MFAINRRPSQTGKPSIIRCESISGTNLIFSILLVTSHLFMLIESSRQNNWSSKRDYYQKFRQSTRRQEIAAQIAPIISNPIAPTTDSLNQSQSNWGSSHFSFPNPADSLPDFSYAGYRSGNMPIPWIDQITKTLSPTNAEDDRTHELQAAIDSLAGKPGVIQFEAGTYLLSNKDSIRLPSSVVLRGQPTIPSTTVIRVSGPPRNLFEIGNPHASGALRPEEGVSQIIQSYVGVGAKSVEVENASQFKIGQSIVVHRLVTESWVADMDMDKLVRNDKHEVWLAPNTSVNQEREITAINGNRIMWEIPLTDSVNVSSSDNTASLVAYQAPIRVQEVGIENMVVIQVPDSSSLEVGKPTILPIRIGGAEDCWIRNVQVTGFVEFTYLTQSSRRITLSDFVVTRDVPTSNGGTGALPLDITMAGSQALLLRGTTIGNQDTASYIVSTGRLAAGPNVVSGYVATGSTQHMIEPHQRWSTGFLVENSHVGQINLKNRGIMGSGHGWAIGNGVIWNCSATKMTVQDPPMSRNFKVNSQVVADFKNFRPINQTDPIDSLYQLQLSLRIGAEAAALVFQKAGPSLIQPNINMKLVQPDVDVVPDPNLQTQPNQPTKDGLLAELIGAL